MIALIISVVIAWFFGFFCGIPIGRDLADPETHKDKITKKMKENNTKLNMHNEITMEIMIAKVLFIYYSQPYGDWSEQQKRNRRQENYIDWLEAEHKAFEDTVGG